MKETDLSWTDERVETLKAMWNDGKSASQIAKELNGVTRNAVIGKVHRLGLSNRTAAASQAAAEKPEARPIPREAARPVPPKEAAPVKPVPVAKLPGKDLPRPVKPVFIAGQPMPPQPSANEVSAEALANLANIEKKAKKLDLMQLTERTCKWPIGDPATDDFWFCGHPCQPGKPYCEAHVAVAFQPMSSRRDRRAGSR